jgi:hypothetical protein
MPSFLFVGETGMEFPQDDGIHASFTCQPGDTIEADTNPDPRWFDPVGGTSNGPVTTNADVAATVANEPTEGTE